MKRRLLIILIFIVLTLVIPLQAANTATITVTEANGTTYTMLPITALMSNAALASGSFITPSGRDVMVSSQPRMLVTDKTMFATPIGPNTATPFYYTTGNTPTDFAIIPGQGGYVTVADAAALELGNNFSIELDGYTGTQISKSGAFEMSHDGTNILAGIPCESLTTTGAYGIGASGFVRAGQKITNLPIGTIASASWYLSGAGSPVGTANIRLRKASDDSIIGTFGTQDVSLVGGGAWYTYSTPVTNTDIQDVYLTFEYNGPQTGFDYVFAYYTNPGLYSNGNGATYSAGAWTDNATHDATFKLALNYPGVSAALAPGEHTIKVYADGTNLKLDVNGVNVDSEALGGASVINNANNWIITPSSYLNYYKHTSTGAERIYYQPNAIIVGTALPNLASGGAYPGVFTFGSNPAGLTTALGPLLSLGQVIPEATVAGSAALVPQVNPNIGPSGGNTGATFPLFGLFNSLLTDYNAAAGTSITMAYVWRGVAVIFAFIFGTCVLIGTRQPLFGLFAYAIGYLVPTLWMGGILDWWVPIMYIIGAVLLILLVAKWGQSSIS